MTGRKDYKRALVTIAGAKCTLTADERGWLIYRHGGYCRISGVYSEGVQILIVHGAANPASAIAAAEKIIVARN